MCDKKTIFRFGNVLNETKQTQNKEVCDSEKHYEKEDLKMSPI